MTDTNTSIGLRSGSLLGARYRLTGPIASGGMATVYGARDEVLGREVAVKIMHPALADDDGFVERFRREAQNAARLNHPNIVTVHDWGREAGAVYMVMELVEGASLRDLLERRGSLELDNVRHIVGEVAKALDHAHATGIVHRDVKPENVLLSGGENGVQQVKVVDFGVARALGDGAGRLTSGSVVGTMHYIAPEQLQSDAVDSRADVYALGLVAYEMLTGRPAFSGDTPAAVAAARLTRSVPSPGISPQVDGAIARATSLRPGDRPSTAGEFAAALGSSEIPAHRRHTLPEGLAAPVTQLPTQVLPHPAPRRRLRDRRWVRRTVFALSLASGLAVLTAGAYALLAPKPVGVPDLNRRSEAGAEAILRRAHLELGRRIEVFDPSGPGTILRTKPPAGARARPGTQVAIVVSKGPEMVDVPQVVGKTLDVASTLVVRAGFTVGALTEDFSSAVDKGEVARQSPGGGRARRGIAIDLVVSKGPELVPVPDVTGKGPDQARAALAAAGLGYGRAQDWSDTVSEGQVIRTSPGAGDEAAKGSTVTVVVSRGPKPFPMPNLVGMDRTQASAQAQSLGLVVANQYAVPGSGKPKDQVQGQSPPAGTQVRKGTAIDLYYAA